MPTLTDVMDEVKALTADLRNRVDDLDKEQNRRWEELTSKTGAMPAEAKSAIDALNNRINELMDKVETEQIEAKRPPLSGGKGKKSAATAAFLKAVRCKGNLDFLTKEEQSLIVPRLMPEGQKALYAGDATTGGFFASTDFVAELQEYRILISKMRQICRKQTTSGEKVQYPALANDTTVYWAQEQSSFSDSNDPTEAMIDIPVHEMRGLLKISEQNLEDSMFDLEGFIKERLGKKFAQKEGAGFVNGNGNGKPLGIMAYTSKASSGYTGGSAGLNDVTDSIPYVLSGAATGKINSDDITNVLMDLKSDYDNDNTAYIMTRATINTIRLFKDSLNRPLWIPYGSGLPATINNRKYVEMPDMPQIASGNLPIAVGDFDNYLIVDRITLNFRQLNELYAASGLVGFIARMRVGGGVLLPEAFRTLKVN